MASCTSDRLTVVAEEVRSLQRPTEMFGCRRTEEVKGTKGMGGVEAKTV